MVYEKEKNILIPFRIFNPSFLTVGMHLLATQLRGCEAVTKRLPTIDVGVQSEQLLTRQRGIAQNSVHTVGTGAVCAGKKVSFMLNL